MCIKICLTKKEATAALNKIQSRRFRNFKSRKEKRMYYCEQHNAWHLTSQEEREKEPEVSLQFADTWKQLLVCEQ